MTTGERVESNSSGQRRQLGGQFQRAFAWGAFGVMAGRGIQFISTLVLARVLVPQDFGALAVALVVQSIAVNVTDLGATAAIGRGGRESSDLLSTVFFISVSTAVLLTVGVAFGAPILADILGDADATPVIQAMSLTILLGGLSGVPAAVVWRDYRQGPKAVIECCGAVLTLVLALLMAGAGWGAMALAWSRVGGQVAITLGYWVISPARIRLAFNSRHARDVLKLGLPLAAANLIVFLALNVDYAIVSRVLGAEMLGFYLLAFTLAGVPSSVVTAAFRSVVVPSFGRLQGNIEAGAAAGHLMSIVCSIALPIAGIITSLAAPLVGVFYGRTWESSVGPLIGLGVFAGGRVLIDFLADVCVGAGRTMGLVWIQIFWLIAAVPAIWAGATLGGLLGVGVAQAMVVWLVIVPICVFVAGRYTKVGSLILVLRTIRPIVAAAVAGTVATAIASSISFQPLALVVAAAGGIAVAAALLARPACRALSSFRRSLDSVTSASGGDRG